MESRTFVYNRNSPDQWKWWWNSLAGSAAFAFFICILPTAIWGYLELSGAMSASKVTPAVVALVWLSVFLAQMLNCLRYWFWVDRKQPKTEEVEISEELAQAIIERAKGSPHPLQAQKVLTETKGCSSDAATFATYE
ncbi:MAG: hypothetical protein ABL962_14125, partial [Fimbriimonadaceae bacterium]